MFDHSHDLDGDLSEEQLRILLTKLSDSRSSCPLSDKWHIFFIGNPFTFQERSGSGKVNWSHYFQKSINRKDEPELWENLRSDSQWPDNQDASEMHGSPLRKSQQETQSGPDKQQKVVDSDSESQSANHGSEQQLQVEQDLNYHHDADNPTKTQSQSQTTITTTTSTVSTTISFPSSHQVGATKSHYLRHQFGVQNLTLLPSNGCFQEFGRCLDQKQHGAPILSNLIQKALNNPFYQVLPQRQLEELPSFLWSGLGKGKQNVQGMVRKISSSRLLWKVMERIMVEEMWVTSDTDVVSKDQLKDKHQFYHPSIIGDLDIDSDIEEYYSQDPELQKLQEKSRLQKERLRNSSNQSYQIDIDQDSGPVTMTSFMRSLGVDISGVTQTLQNLSNLKCISAVSPYQQIPGSGAAEEFQSTDKTQSPNKNTKSQQSQTLKPVEIEKMQEVSLSPNKTLTAKTVNRSGVPRLPNPPSLFQQHQINFNPNSLTETYTRQRTRYYDPPERDDVDDTSSVQGKTAVNNTKSESSYNSSNFNKSQKLNHGTRSRSARLAARWRRAGILEHIISECDPRKVWKGLQMGKTSNSNQGQSSQTKDKKQSKSKQLKKSQSQSESNTATNTISTTTTTTTTTKPPPFPRKQLLIIAHSFGCSIILDLIKYFNFRPDKVILLNPPILPGPLFYSYDIATQGAKEGRMWEVVQNWKWPDSGIYVSGESQDNCIRGDLVESEVVQSQNQSDDLNHVKFKWKCYDSETSSSDNDSESDSEDQQLESSETEIDLINFEQLKHDAEKKPVQLLETGSGVKLIQDDPGHENEASEDLDSASISPLNIRKKRDQNTIVTAQEDSTVTVQEMSEDQQYVVVKATDAVLPDPVTCVSDESDKNIMITSSTATDVPSSESQSQTIVALSSRLCSSNSSSEAAAQTVIAKPQARNPEFKKPITNKKKKEKNNSKSKSKKYPIITIVHGAQDDQSDILGSRRFADLHKGLVKLIEIKQDSNSNSAAADHSLDGELGTWCRESDFTDDLPGKWVGRGSKERRRMIDIIDRKGVTDSTSDNINLSENLDSRYLLESPASFKWLGEIVKEVIGKN